MNSPSATATAANKNGKISHPAVSQDETPEISFEDLVLVVPEDSVTEAEFLRHQLAGHHRISVMSQAGLSDLDINFKNVSFELEGVAAWRSVVEEMPQIAEEGGVTGLIDIGGGNANFSMYLDPDSVDPVPGSRKVLNTGVQRLIEAIAGDTRFTNLAKASGSWKTPEAPAVHAAIVDATYKVGAGFGRFSFEAIFSEVVAEWLNSIIQDAAAHWRRLNAYDDLQRIVVVGGGAEIASRLELEGGTIPILFPSLPQIANARGCLFFPDYMKTTLVVDGGNHFLKVASKWGDIVLPSPSGLPAKDRHLTPRSFRSTPHAYYLELQEGGVFNQYSARNESPGWVFGRGVEQHVANVRSAFKGQQGKTSVIPSLALFGAYLAHLKREEADG